MEMLSRGWKIFGCLGVIFWVVLIGAVLISNEDSPEEIAQQKIERLFNPWDGSHLELTKVIKSNLKDPDSFEHIETTYLIQGDSMIVQTKYRAKNSFGGVVVESVTAITDKETGTVLEWMPQQ